MSFIDLRGEAVYEIAPPQAQEPEPFVAEFADQGQAKTTAHTAGRTAIVHSSSFEFRRLLERVPSSPV